eukprot:scaffold109998_cov63-Attheya_sp.AAC.3
MEDPTQPGILLLEQQPSDTQESVAPDPVATEETTATTESDDQEELPIGDLPNQVPTDTDRKLMGVYGDYVHQNDGTHLDGGIAYDKIWQARWQKLVALPIKRYDAPGGHVGRQFIEVLADELEGIRKGKWNSNRFIVFQMVILQQSKI